VELAGQSAEVDLSDALYKVVREIQAERATIQSPTFKESRSIFEILITSLI